ncbi:hypothetical protein DACRYDRAFT_112412 [Dacryopinax primogenitus]|uniref:Beta-glucuronidase C-terminal domain-containing protein n=1 Tax=Dacryopinax primogenitus (strain DJM 731) TaxID=1858805 RepID=M5FU83_DACPD|nr:uncharacterized protein DACRYDRAFT_112412 [Dacryopinax primogenitus]EJT96791.1 hypothetical protein DACRYDRAFT_112412 [Dacryopinax primogenitus]
MVWHVLLLVLVVQATVVKITLPHVVPSSQLVSTFPVGLSIEQDHFPIWAGPPSAQNTYTQTLLKNVVDRSGVPPPVRVGGTTEDRTWLAPNTSILSSAAVFPPSSNASTSRLYPEATLVYAGPEFWESARNFPNGTEFTFGINLRAQDPVMAREVARMAWESVQGTGVKLRAFEIGNEPDMYGNWSATFYASNWNAAALSIVNASLPYGQPTFQLFAFANPSARANFSISGALNAGVAAPERLRGLARIASEHHYQWSTKIADLMSKSIISSQLDQFSPEISAAQKAGLQFEFGETGSVGGHGAPGVSNVAGSVIWAVSYTFQALTRGVKRLYFHNGLCYRYNFFQPVSSCADDTHLSGAHILPMYHLLLVVAEALSYPGPVRVGELQTGAGEVSAWGVWAADTDQLLRVVLVNSAPYTSGTRASYAYTFSNLPPSASGSSNSSGSPSSSEPALGQPWIRRLFVPGVESMGGLTWAGQSYETTSGKAGGKRVDELLAVTPASGAGAGVGEDEERGSGGGTGSIQGWESEVLVLFFREG